MASPPDRKLPQQAMPSSFWVNPGRAVGELRRAHGDVFRLQVRPDQFVICATGVEAQKVFLIDHLDKVSNYEGWYRFVPAPAVIGKGLVFMDGPEHRWFRQALTPPYSQAEVAAHVPVIEEIVLRRLDTWPKDGVIGLHTETSAMAFHIAASFVLGKTPGDDVQVLHDLYSQLMTPQAKERMLKRARMAQELMPLIEARRAKPTGDVLSQIIKSGGPKGPLSDDEILSHVNTLMVAGHLTASSLSAYLLLLLVSHPRHLPALLEEQMATDSVDMDALGRMPLLDHVLMEAERMVSPIPHVPRRILEDMEFQGHQLRAGEFLFCSLAGTNRDPSFWTDPHKFDPTRFAPPRSERRGHPYALAGFSVGPRRCLGTLLAQVMVKVMVHHILRRFTLKPERGAFAPSVSIPARRPINRMPFHVEARS